MKKDASVFARVQQFGQALLVPVALLPAGGLLYGLGIAMTSDNLLAVLPVFSTGIWPMLAKLMSTLGSIIFGNLALLFAVGVSIGMAKNHDGTAGLSAVAGYLVMNSTICTIMGLTAEVVSANSEMYQSVLGTYTLRTGVFGGIIIGLVSAWAYNRFHTLKLPEYLGFFSAKRSVPIISVFLSIIVGVVMCIVWPPIQNVLSAFSDFLLNGSPRVGVFLYGLIVKLLNPLGLHTAFYTPFQYQFGSYVTLAGETVMGDKAIFFAQLADSVPIKISLTSRMVCAWLAPLYCFGSARSNISAMLWLIVMPLRTAWKCAIKFPPFWRIGHAVGFAKKVGKCVSS